MHIVAHTRKRVEFRTHTHTHSLTPTHIHIHIRIRPHVCVYRIDRSITRDWPAIRDAFSIESMGECFAKIAEANHQLATLFERCDVVVVPALGLEAYGARGPAVQIAMGQTKWDPNRDPFVGMMPLNYSGHPSSVIRAGLTDSGLPCAVQLVSERGRDADSLLLSSIYEREFSCFSTWPAWPFRSVAAGAIARL